MVPFDFKMFLKSSNKRLTNSRLLSENCFLTIAGVNSSNVGK